MERPWVEMSCRTNYPIKRVLVVMENNGIIDMEDDVTKFWVSWVTRQVVEDGLGYAVNSAQTNLKMEKYLEINVTS